MTLNEFEKEGLPAPFQLVAAKAHDGQPPLSILLSRHVGIIGLDLTVAGRRGIESLFVNISLTTARELRDVLTDMIQQEPPVEQGIGPATS